MPEQHQPRLCNVPDCGLRATSRGLCVKHYCRLKATTAEARQAKENNSCKK